MNPKVKLDGLRLPPCLERRGDGAIVIAGHRITLFAFLEAVREEGEGTVGGLRVAFPTVGAGTLQELLDFCRQHQDALQQFCDEQQAIADENRRKHVAAPSLHELRRRKNGAS